MMSGVRRAVVVAVPVARVRGPRGSRVVFGGLCYDYDPGVYYAGDPAQAGEEDV
jgi:hypothetical protein